MQLPGPVRACVGLLAVAADEAQRLPDRAIELPMLAVSTALQMSLRAQQRYARLTARGDEVLNRRRPGDEPPPWATFDESAAAVPEDPVPQPTTVAEARNSAGPGPTAGALLDELWNEANTDDSGNDDQPRRAKTINAPRHTSPSRFDTVGDD